MNTLPFPHSQKYISNFPSSYLWASSSLIALVFLSLDINFFHSPSPCQKKGKDTLIFFASASMSWHPPDTTIQYPQIHYSHFYLWPQRVFLSTLHLPLVSLASSIIITTSPLLSNYYHRKRHNPHHPSLYHHHCEFFLSLWKALLSYYEIAESRPMSSGMLN